MDPILLMGNTMDTLKMENCKRQNLTYFSKMALAQTNAGIDILGPAT